MADKPSRALILYGDGLASLLSVSHSSLHSFASLSCCGFLSLRNSPPNQDCSSDGAIKDFAQLLDAYDFYIAKNEQGDECSSGANKNQTSVPKLSEKFMGLKSAIFTNSPSITSFASELSLQVLNFKDFEFSEIPSHILSLLGFSQGKFLEKSEFDLIFLHITPETLKTQKGKNSADFLDQLVGAILEISKPGSEISSRLLLSVILSYDANFNNSGVSLKNSQDELNSDLALIRPRQSYTMKNGKLLDDIRHENPMLIAQWQDGVTRRDKCKAFSFEEFTKEGGNLAMLAERFLHEVAFKLWKAPKYGA